MQETTGNTWEDLEKELGIFYRPAGFSQRSRITTGLRHTGKIDVHSGFTINIPEELREKRKRQLLAVGREDSEIEHSQAAAESPLRTNEDTALSQTSDVVLSSTRIERYDRTNFEEEINTAGSIKRPRLSPIKLQQESGGTNSAQENLSSPEMKSREIANPEHGSTQSTMEITEEISVDHHEETVDADSVKMSNEEEVDVEVAINNSGFISEDNENPNQSTTNLTDNSFEQNSGVAPPVLTKLATLRETLVDAKKFLNMFKVTKEPKEKQKIASEPLCTEPKITSRCRIGVYEMEPPPYDNISFGLSNYTLSQSNHISGHLDQWRYNLEKQVHKLAQGN